ncbi:MAG TPA: DUF3617 family protein [Terriglobales bacterium]|nr:DUF3617 family protein [Terriglobales bacterium]
MLKFSVLATALPLACALGLTQSASAPVVPMNVKTGLWENHSTLTVSGGLGLPPEVLAKMTPEQRARYTAALGAGQRTHDNVEKGCLTKEDLTQDPTKMLNPGGGEGVTCHGDVITSTATDLEVHSVCTGAAQSDMRIKVHAVDQEHVTGEGAGSATMNGHTMQTAYKFDSHWLGATCPANSGSGLH